MDIKEIKLIGVVGAGQMGSGIAEVIISSGFQALMRDVNQEAVERGKKRIIGDLDRRVQKGKITADEQKTTMGRLSITTRMEDFKGCDLVIEAATENVPLKKEIFKTLDEVTRKTAILASNTSLHLHHPHRFFYQKTGQGSGHAFLPACSR